MIQIDELMLLLDGQADLLGCGNGSVFAASTPDGDGEVGL